MSRVIKEYVCTCDRCGRIISHERYENDVKFNKGEYVFCDDCYRDLLMFFNLWKGVNLNNSSEIIDEID